jgi:hypothetical protein
MKNPMNEEAEPLGELERWIRIGGFEIPIGTHYGVDLPPNEGRLAQVHEDDNAKNYVCSVLLGDARAIMKVVKRCFYPRVREKGMLQ